MYVLEVFSIITVWQVERGECELFTSNHLLPPTEAFSFYVDLFTFSDGSTFTFLYFWIQLRQLRAECLPIELKTHLKKVRVAFEDERRPGRFSCHDGIMNGI